MAQPSDGLSLGVKPAAMFAVQMGAASDELDGHDAVQGDLPRAIDDAHAAFADLFKAVVTGDGQSFPGRRHRDVREQIQKVIQRIAELRKTVAILLRGGSIAPNM